MYQNQKQKQKIMDKKKNWKIMSRYQCEICDIWMDNNKASISLHENGWKHKNNVRMRLDLSEKVKKNYEKVVKKYDNNNNQNRTNKSEIITSNNTGNYQQHPLILHFDINKPNDDVEGYSNIFDETEEHTLQEGEIAGQYFNFDSQFLYLMGDWHEDMIIPNMVCEVIDLKSNDGDWKSAMIEKVIDNQNIEVKLFDEGIEDEDENEKEIKLIVSSSDIRFIAPMPPERSITGLGEWKTVSITNTNLSQTNENNDSNMEEDVDNFLSKITKSANENKKEENEEESVYKTFNPFGGSYRGVKIDTIIENNNPNEQVKTLYSNLDEDLSSKEPKSIKFKKRISRKSDS